MGEASVAERREAAVAEVVVAAVAVAAVAVVAGGSYEKIPIINI